MTLDEMLRQALEAEFRGQAQQITRCGNISQEARELLLEAAEKCEHLASVTKALAALAARAVEAGVYCGCESNLMRFASDAIENAQWHTRNADNLRKLAEAGKGE